MKTLRLLIILFIGSSAYAGMPNAEMSDALIVSTEKTAAGWVAYVTGPIDVFLADGHPEKAARIRLYADKAKIRVPVGNPLHSLSLRGAALYEQRMKESVGQKMLIQIWGANLIIEGGRVVDVVAGEISFLHPTKAEASFDAQRLFEIQAR
jgi:hypothetical protein